MRDAWRRSRQEDKVVAAFQPAFANYPDDWKRALKELEIKGSIAEHEVTEPMKFRHIGLVYVEGHTGRFYLLPNFARIVERLIKEWESEGK